MKKKEKKLLREKTITQLRSELVVKQKVLLEERLKKAQNKRKDVKKSGRLKKEIAIFKTIIKEKLLKGDK